METPSLRVRLVFEDRSILSKTQRSDGMNQSWLLLKLQQHRTISDVCTHLLHIFKLHRSCPNGILLSMEGFVLPPFESTEILKDKEIICVKKKGGAVPDAVEAADAGTLLDEVEVHEMEPGDNGLLLLANDKFDKETREYQSESKEVDEEQLHDEASPGEAVSKKRKASMKLQYSKKKKRCLGVLDDSEDEAETEEIDHVNNDASHPSKKEKIPNCKSKPNEETIRSAATSSKKVIYPSIVKRSEQLQENVEEVNQVSTAPGAKKIPSRSARRKKAKRQWMREVAKISKKKPHPYSKPEVTKADNKEANGRPKGLLHWKQAPKKPVHKHTIAQETNQNGDVGTEITPVVTRPGHIRFEPLDEDHAAKQTGVSNEILKWKGITSKKKGQKWGTEKFSTSRRNDSKRINKESFRMWITDTQVPVIDPNDFDNLPPCCSPKEGDVIAYRLLELSSSWIPEFSSFRVGRISYYDARDIVLIPVPEYPIVSDMNEDRPDDSLYGEDGILEINFSALVDVRNVKQYDPDAMKAVSNGVNQTCLSDDKDAAENLVSNSNDNKTKVSKDSNPGDGEVNPWDRFSKVNSKNTEMSEANHSSMVGSGVNPCSDGAPGPSEAPDANEAESSEERVEQKGSSSGNPWLNASKPELSQENNFHNTSSLAGWTDVKKAGSSENDCEKGSSWGRPWSSFGASRGSSIKEQNKENDWYRGSSRGNGKPRSCGAPRGRGRGRGRGRNAKMM